MPLDIDLFRPERGNPEIIRVSQRRRYADVNTVDAIISVDEKWRQSKSRGDTLRMMKGIVSKRFGALKKAKAEDGTDADVPADVVTALDALTAELIDPLSILQLGKLSKLIDAEVVAEEARTDALDVERQTLVYQVGNIVHEDVPVDNDEDNNAILRKWGTCKSKADVKFNHYDIMSRLGCLDTSKRAIDVAGSRGFFLSGRLVILHQAIVAYATRFLVERKYKPLMTPVFMLERPLSAVAQLSQFKEELYSVGEQERQAATSGDAAAAGDDIKYAGSGSTTQKYLIATSEQPIAAYMGFRNYTDADFKPFGATAETPMEPIRIAGHSTCFRREVGSHGRDTSGIFRVHQFDKIEQFVVCPPEMSWAALDEMIATSEAFFQSLGIPYRVVDIVSGALNNAAARKFDLECWFPASETYRELVSCSNCTDYQSRGVNARYGQPGEKGAGGEREAKQYVHYLNGTLCALTRTLCVIMENYLTETGVSIPEVRRICVSISISVCVCVFSLDQRVFVPFAPSFSSPSVPTPPRQALVPMCGFSEIPFDPAAVAAEEERLAKEARENERKAAKKGSA